MFASVNLIRPVTLELRRKYLRREREAIFDRLISSSVFFIAFDPCPAFVVVQSPEGVRYRCPRDEVYLYPDDDRREEVTG